MEFFVDAVSDYKSDFVLFPEYFNAPLMAKFNNEGESQAIRGLAAYTEEIKERFVKLAISYNINIITGSMPLIKEDGLLYNVGFLCRRDGSYEMYEKIHVTPDENSFLTRMKYDMQISDLEEQIDEYNSQYERDDQKLKELRRNPRAITKIARENYMMKADDEDIFVLSDDEKQETSKNETAE